MNNRPRNVVRASLLASAISAALAGCGSSSESASTPGASTSATSPTSFRDGTYSAEGIYGNEPSSIGVTLTVIDGVVTEVDVQTRATNPTSLELQERFAEAVPEVVVGRPLADLEVDKLAGSSGTPVGFNDALDQIRRTADAE